MPPFSHESIYQPATGGSGRTLLLLHGTGGDEHSLLDLGRRLDPQAALLGVRGRTLENGQPRWFRRLAEGVLDEADIVLRAAELAEFVATAQTVYGIDRQHMIAMGYSNGANIAAALLLLHPGVLREAMLLRPMLLLEPGTPPDTHGTRVLISAGQNDPYSLHGRVERLAELLRAGGGTVDMVWQQAGHELRPADLRLMLDWLEPLANQQRGS